VRKLGLKVALSVKFAQGDLHIVDNLHVNSHKTKVNQEMIVLKLSASFTNSVFV
jgi:ribosomal protein L4